MSVKADPEPLAPRRRGPEGSEWSEPVKVFDAVRYKRDGSGAMTPIAGSRLPAAAITIAICALAVYLVAGLAE